MGKTSFVYNKLVGKIGFGHNQVGKTWIICANLVEKKQVLDTTMWEKYDSCTLQIQIFFFYEYLKNTISSNDHVRNVPLLKRILNIDKTNACFEHYLSDTVLWTISVLVFVLETVFRVTYSKHSEQQN